MEITYTIDINTAPEQVWYWLDTPKRAMVWQTSISKTEVLPSEVP